jgi:tRNA dimethylallyltransferase
MSGAAPSRSPSPRAGSAPGAPFFIAGPTAAGKSEVALLLAEQLGGEIISVDSMQVYRGLDLGTAKPSPAERARVPHHLIDVADLNEPFDAAKFIGLAQKAVAEIQSRQRVPIFCGGTGLYFKAFLEGLGEAPPADAKLRAELEAAPLADLLRELAERDPATFEKIDRQNPRRVIRAIEVIRLTGKPFSAQRARWGETPACADEAASAVVALWRDKSARRRPGEPRLGIVEAGSRGRSPHHAEAPASRIFGFSRSPADLHARINARVDEMFRRGLVAETGQLLKRGLAENKTAMQALGYRQVVEHLRGEHSLAETIELVKVKTRQYAKRQMTWFRRQLKVDWIEFAPKDNPETAAALVKARIGMTR